MYRNADQMIDQLSEEQKRQYHTEFKIWQSMLHMITSPLFSRT